MKGNATIFEMRLFVERVKLFFTEKIPFHVAHWLPRRVALWTYIRVHTHSWAKRGNLTPDEISYRMAHDDWVNR